MEEERAAQIAGTLPTPSNVAVSNRPNQRWTEQLPKRKRTFGRQIRFYTCDEDLEGFCSIGLMTIVAKAAPASYASVPSPMEILWYTERPLLL